jgi:hypothetical protein
MWRHLSVLGNQIITLLYIYCSGREEVGERVLSELMNTHPQTCRRDLLTLEAFGYVKRSGRYNGYSLTPLAYQFLPLRQNDAPPAPEAAPVNPAPSSPEPPSPHHHAANPARQLDPERENFTLANPSPESPPHHHAADPARQLDPERENFAFASDGVNDGDGGIFNYYINFSFIPNIPPQPLTSSSAPKQPFRTGAAGRPAPPEPQGMHSGKTSPSEGEPVTGSQDQDPEEAEPVPRSPEEIKSARRMLRALGIGEPTRSQLLRLEWVTEEYIRAWRESLDEHPGRGIWKSGLLILRLRSQEWPPETDAYAPENRSYSSGEFADFIEP